MNRKLFLIAWMVVLTLLVGAGSAAAQQDKPPVRPDSPTTLGTAFTYQGELKKGTTPVTGSCNFQFSLWDAASGGTQIGGTQALDNVPLTNGRFVVSLDFGAAVFPGDARWLEIAVKCVGDIEFTTLIPRQDLTATPYALYSSGNWGLNGTSGTNPNNFLGTTDDVTLTFRVSNTVGLRLTSNSGGTPNVVGGYFENAVAPGVTGATIAGGGYPGYWFFGQYIYRHNRVTANFGTIGGGLGNVVAGIAATIGGGSANDAYGSGATVSGGGSNTAWNASSTIGGGVSNVVQGDAGTIGGGSQNVVNGYAATIPGGASNAATMSYTLAAGHRASANHQGAFVWADSTSADFASTANDQFLIRANGGVGINTNVPSRTLDVNGIIGVFDGGTRTYYGGLASELGGSLVEMGINDDGTNRFGGSYNSTAQGGLFRVDTRNGKKLFQFWGRPEGAFGLLPLATLNTAGVLAIYGLGSAGSISLCINGYGEISSCSSSIRYKNNVADLNLGLDTIAKLRPVTFNWKDSGQADLGFVAEDVNQVTPLLTTLNKDGQIEGVKYDRITAILVKGIQEQQQQIEALTAQNAAQQQEIAQLQRGTAQSDPSFNFFNVISLIALGGVVAIGLKQKRGSRS